MADTAKPPQSEPMSVDVVRDGIVLDGDENPAVKLTPDAAIETGIRLVNAGIGLDDDIQLSPRGTSGKR